MVVLPQPEGLTKTMHQPSLTPKLDALDDLGLALDLAQAAPLRCAHQAAPTCRNLRYQSALSFSVRRWVA